MRYSKKLGKISISLKYAVVQSSQGKLDKNGKALKFSRDLESDWTVKNEVPHFGLKEHASVDTRYGFVLSTEMTPASHHDSP